MSEDKEELTPSQQISKLIAEAQQLVYAAENIADKNGENFNMDLGGYGMGGWYRHTPEGEDPEKEEDYERCFGWMASSHSC